MVWIRQQPSCLVVVFDEIAEGTHVCKCSSIFLISASTVAGIARKLEDTPEFVLQHAKFNHWPFLEYAHLLNILQPASIQKCATNCVE
jgi:hypothetical protein